MNTRLLWILLHIILHISTFNIAAKTFKVRAYFFRLFK